VGYAARAKPDGYTLVQSNAGFTVMSNMYKDLPFDFTNGMTHVTTELSVPLILVVAKDAPINSVQELLAYAKANPGKTNYGSPGIGTLQHLAAELLKKRTGMEAMHVPFKGASPMIVDLIAGREQFAFDTSASAITHIKGGRVKPLAVTSSTRLAALPNVPTVAESGVPGYEMTAWYSLAGPKGMPRAAIDRITKAVQDSMQDPSKQKFLAEMAADPGGMDHDKFNVLVQKTAKDLDELTRGMAPQ
jgi:tripartite-type tricarboxylate transporter receptor subunit TctC